MIRSRKARYLTIGASSLMAVGLIGGGVVVAQEGADGPAPDGQAQQDGQRHHRSDKGHHALRHIADASGLDASTFTDGFENGMTVNEVLAANNVNSDVVLAMVLADLDVKLGEKVSDGAITQEEADEKLAGAETRLTELMDSTPTHQGERDHGRKGDQRRGAGLDIAADTIGITSDELKEALHDGSTIADVADANGSSADAVIAAMVASATERIDAAVTDGKITSERADEMKSTITDRITDLVNNGHPERTEGDRPERDRPERPADEA